MANFEFEYDANQLLDVMKELIKRLDTKDQRSVGQYLALQDQNNKQLEGFLGQTTSQAELLAADPQSPGDGRMWINTTANQFKIQMNGVTKVVTVT